MASKPMFQEPPLSSLLGN